VQVYRLHSSPPPPSPTRSEEQGKYMQDCSQCCRSGMGKN
jgi:hypothetical protein